MLHLHFLIFPQRESSNYVCRYREDKNREDNSTQKGVHHSVGGKM